MKKLVFKLCATIALTAMVTTTANAQWTYAGGNLNATQTYDGLGVDNALNPLTQGVNTDNDYIANTVGTTGSLIVQSGSLTIIASDFKIGQNGGFGTLFISNNATLNISQIGQWGGGIGQSADSSISSMGIVTIASGATFNWFVSGSTEQRFMFGNGAVNGHPGVGTLIINGGTMNLNYDPAQTITDGEAQFRVGSDNGLGTVYLNSGTLYDNEPLPFALGGKYTGLTGTPVFNQSTTVSTLNISNGIFVMTNICTQTDAGKSTVTVGNTSYINFISGGTGYLSLNNWIQSDYEALVTAGWIRIDGNTTTVASFQYSNISGQGIYKLTDPTVSTPSILSSNVAYAGEIRVLSTTAGGTAPFTYQWQRNDNGAGFVNISGAHSQTYTQDTTGLLGNYDYQVIVTNGVSNVNTSGVATLTVNAAQSPSITSDTTPTSISRYVGGTATFSAAFDGNHPITYQWQADTGTGYTNIPGATTTTLTLTNLQYTQAGNYRLAATNVISSNASTPATLTILNPAGLQFTWSAPVSITNLTADQVLTNTLGGALGVVGAAVFGNPGTIVVTLTGGRTVTFKNDGSIATCTAQGSTGSGAYPAATSLTTGNANFNSVLNRFNSDGGPQTITLNNLQVGQKYSVQLIGLDNRAGSTNRLSNFQDGDDTAISIETSATVMMGDNAYIVGTFTASNTTETIIHNLPTGNTGNMNALVLRAISFVPSNAPVVITPPASQKVFVGRSVQFSVTVDSYVAPTYQWQTNSVNVGNGGVFSGTTTSTLNISDVTGLDGYQISCVVSNPVGNATGGPATLTVLALPPTSGTGGTYVMAQSPVAYWPLNETFNVSGGGMPTYDAASNHDGLYLPVAYNAFNGIVGPQPADGYSQFAVGQGALSPFTNLTNTWAIVPGMNLNTNTVTISMWLNPSGPQFDYTGLLLDRNTGTEAGMNYTTGQRLGYTWNNNNSGTWSYVSGPVIPTNMWSFVALVITPTNASFYVINTNGVSATTYVQTHTNMTWSGSTAPDPLIRIGSDNALNRTFNGVIDEVAVFNRSLNQNEVASLVTSAPLFVTQPQNLTLGVLNPAQFNVSVASLTSVTYQWKTNGVSVGNGGVFSGATSNVLSISSIAGLNGMVFSVAVTNATGSALSAGATLAVVTPAGNNQYWDTNGATAGAGGTAPAGTWDLVATNWTMDSTGASAATVWTNGNNAIFSAGTDATAQFNVTVGASGVGINNLTQNSGRVRLITGAVSMLNSTCVMAANTRVSADFDLRIDSVLSGVSGISKTGPGILMLTGNNTFSGGVSVNDGLMNFETQNNCFGSGTLTLNGGNIAKTFANAAVTIPNTINVTGSSIVQSIRQGGQGGDIVFTGNWLAGSTSGNFAVTNNLIPVAAGISGASVQAASLRVVGDISAYVGTFTQTPGNNRLRFGPTTAGNFGVIDGSHAKWVTHGALTSGNGIDLGDGAYGTWKMGELSGDGGFINVGFNTTAGVTTLEIGALNTSTTYGGRINNNGTGLAALTKIGSGTLTLSNCTYTGVTTVSNGTSRLNAPFLTSATNVVIAPAGKLDLNFVGTNVVKGLIIAGVVKPNGTYGATGSGAANIDDVHFAGTGRLKVTGSTPVLPGSLTSSVSGSTLLLSWPAEQGWTLQQQTNSLSTGLGTNWTTLVPSGSGVTSTNITIDPAKPTVFYRLVYP